MKATNTKAASPKASKAQLAKAASLGLLSPPPEATKPPSGIASFVTQAIAVPTVTQATPQSPVVTETKPVPTEPKPAKVVIPREEQNGRKSYTPGTKGALIWATADALTNQLGRIVTVQEMRDALIKLDANGQPTKDSIKLLSINAGYSHWRKFNGISGRIAKPQAIAPTPVVNPIPVNPVPDAAT